MILSLIRFADSQEDTWLVPFWYVDAGAEMMLALLADEPPRVLVTGPPAGRRALPVGPGWCCLTIASFSLQLALFARLSGCPVKGQRCQLHHF
jgi:hypothetical protein